MNTKLTIRLIGYSVIAIWSVWLIGRSYDSESTVEGTSVIEEGGQVGTAEEPPLPIVEAKQAKSIRLYVDQMLASDEQINELIDFVRMNRDEPTWSEAVKAVMTDVIRITERSAFESGQLYVECGGGMCLLRGDLNMDTTLVQLPAALWSASSSGDVRFSTVKSQQTAEHGTVFVVVAPNFAVPTRP
ncbi:MAG: hypothetical protein AAF465_09730 [Pseudomonadota bacterium]